MKKFGAFVLLLTLCLALAGCKTNYVYDNSSAYAAGGATLSQTVEEIDVDWVSGEVEISYYNGAYVSFSETADKEISGDFALRYLVEGNKLTVRYASSGKFDFKGNGKTLKLLVPENANLSFLSVNTVSADVTVEGITAAAAEVKTVSGDLELRSANFTELELETVSGDADVYLASRCSALTAKTVSGDLEFRLEEVVRFDVNTTSGDVTLKTGILPSSGRMESVSGDLELHLPQGSEFAVRFSSVSGSIDNALGETSGAPVLFRFETTSGDVKIEALADNALGKSAR